MHSWLIPRLLSRFKDPPVDRQGHTGWSTRSAGRVRNGRFLAQGRRSASSLRTPRGLTTPARIRSFLSVATCTLPTSACSCIGSLARSGGLSIVMTAPTVDYKIHWLKMMSVPESRAVVGRHEGINGMDSARIGPDRRQKCHSGPPKPPLGPQSSGSARRWPSFEGELHVERCRATLNGLGGFHMGNPGLDHRPSPAPLP